MSAAVRGNGTAPRLPVAGGLRVKVGPNPYSNRHTCAHCREEFEKGGFWIRLELAGTVVDMPLCEGCLAAGALYETLVPFDEHHPSSPLGLACHEPDGRRSMKIRLNDGAEFEGSPVEILEQMKSGTMFTETKTIDEYIDFLVDTVRKFQSKTVTVAGKTTAERAASLLDGFKAAGMAEEVA